MALERLYPKCNNTGCHLNKSCNRTATKIERSVYHTSDNPVDVMFISDCPTSKEVVSPIAFLGPEKSLIHEVVSQVCPDTVTLAYTYLVRGWPCDTSTSKYYDPRIDVKRLSAKDISWVRSVSLSTYPKKQEIINS